MEHVARRPRHGWFLILAVVFLTLGTAIGARTTVAQEVGPEAAFTAVHRGEFALSNCPLLGVLRTSCKLALNGSGRASLLGDTIETGNLTANLNLLPLECGELRGVIRLTQRDAPDNSITTVVNGQICAPLLGGILGGNAPFTLNYRVINGTGAFAGATGTGTIRGTANFNLLSANGSYSDLWRGNLIP